MELTYNALVDALLKQDILTQSEINRLGEYWLSQIIAWVNQGISANRIQELLIQNGVGIRRQRLLRLIRFIRQYKIEGIVKKRRVRIPYPGREITFEGIDGRWSFELIYAVIDAYQKNIPYYIIARQLHISIAYTKSFYDYLKSSEKPVRVMHFFYEAREPTNRQCYDACDCEFYLLPYTYQSLQDFWNDIADIDPESVFIPGVAFEWDITIEDVKTMRIDFIPGVRMSEAPYQCDALMGICPSVCNMDVPTGIPVRLTKA